MNPLTNTIQWEKPPQQLLIPTGLNKGDLVKIHEYVGDECIEFRNMWEENWITGGKLNLQIAKYTGVYHDRSLAKYTDGLYRDPRCPGMLSPDV